MKSYIYRYTTQLVFDEDCFGQALSLIDPWYSIDDDVDHGFSRLYIQSLDWALLDQQLQILAQDYQIDLTFERAIEPMEWQSNAQQELQPVQVGSLQYIREHDLTSNLSFRRDMHLYSSFAFGTGKHATTSGCLILLQRLMKRSRLYRILDMGCGSGILAMSAFMLDRSLQYIEGVDMDEPSVRVACAMRRANAYNPQIKFRQGTGFSPVRLYADRSYDLILANILAVPLINMAQIMVQKLRPGGRVILSGFIKQDSKWVLKAYVDRGMKIEQSIIKDGWVAVLLSKTA